MVCLMRLRFNVFSGSSDNNNNKVPLKIFAMSIISPLLLSVCALRLLTFCFRTIINGLCYLATFVFGVNSIGLMLYAGQLALGSITENPKTSPTSEKDDGQLSQMASAEITANVIEPSSSDTPENSDDTKSP